MNTNMTGFRCFSIFFSGLLSCIKVAAALKGLKGYSGN